MTNDTQSIIDEFKQAVNMAPKELGAWLETAESQSVGQKNGDAESIGHQSGKQIVEILQKRKSDYSDGDLSHMRKVVSYVRRHSAQKPDGDVKETRWRYSLMNWGHDPLR